MNISKFKKGQIITRTNPIEETTDGFGLINSCRTTSDYRCVGEKVELIGIANGMIYLRDEKKTIELYHKKYQNDWDTFVDPKTL